MNDDVKTIPDLKEAITYSYESVLEWIQKQDDTDFLRRVEKKWSTGRQLDHLIKSVIPLNNALRLPKFLLRLMFGKPSNRERTYSELVTAYQYVLEQGGEASGRYIPDQTIQSDKKDLLSRYQAEKRKLINNLDLWNEQSLSSYRLPHPLLGKITVREMLFFTIYHNLHHLNTIKSINRSDDEA